MATLELKGITKRFPGVLANDRVDLKVSSGEILGLLDVESLRMSVRFSECP